MRSVSYTIITMQPQFSMLHTNSYMVLQYAHSQCKKNQPEKLENQHHVSLNMLTVVLYSISKLSSILHGHFSMLEWVHSVDKMVNFWLQDPLQSLSAGPLSRD